MNRMDRLNDLIKSWLTSARALKHKSMQYVAHYGGGSFVYAVLYAIGLLYGMGNSDSCIIYLRVTTLILTTLVAVFIELVDVSCEGKFSWPDIIATVLGGFQSFILVGM